MLFILTHTGDAHMGHVLSFIHMRSLSGCSVFGTSLELSICVCVCMLSSALYKDF